MGSGKAPGLLCICQICTCGRHRCVHRPKADARPKGNCVFTEYKDTYKAFSNYEPVRPIKPDSATKLSNQPFNADTSYKHAFVSHEVKPHQRRAPAKYTKPSGKVDGTSSYQYDYIEKFAQKMPSARPAYRPSTADRPFSDTTVHRETYKPWEMSVRQGIRPPPAIKLPTGTFEHQTTFQDDFKGHKSHSREPIIIPEPALSLNAGKMTNQTTTRGDYTAKDARPEKSAKPVQHLIRNAAPFNHRTTFQNNYKWPDGQPANSCKPPEMTHLPSDPLQSDTTHNLTYQAWNVPKRQGWKPRNGWTAPCDPFDHKTTFQHDYVGKPVEPAKSARPEYNKIHPGEFDGLTTHKNEFKPWGVNPRESFRPAHCTDGPKTKFDGKTTFQTDFKASSTSRPKLCIPKEGGFAFSGDQNFRTMYRETYHGERPPSCPAKSLEVRLNTPSKTGHMYKLDHNGHQFFSRSGGGLKESAVNGTLMNSSLPVLSAAVNGTLEVMG